MVICRPPKLSNGGGEVVSHSRVVACHGLSAALGPLKRPHSRLYKKMNCVAPSSNAATVMNRLVGISGTMKSATNSEYRRTDPVRPIKCKVMKTQYTRTKLSQKCTLPRVSFIMLPHIFGN